MRSDDGYRLSDRLLARQRRQDDAINPQLRQWGGTWITLVITSVGTDARTRATLRTTLQEKRFGELREGVWLRPDNLDVNLPAELLDRVRVLQSRDDNPGELAARLWDLRVNELIDLACRSRLRGDRTRWCTSRRTSSPRLARRSACRCNCW